MKNIVSIKHIWIAVFSLAQGLISSDAVSQVYTDYNAAGTYTFTVGCGVDSLTVQCWGGGGAGGGGTRGGGGGGGAFSFIRMATTPGATYSVTVGAGGIPTTGNGGNGTASNFSTLVVAAAGKGGSSGNGGNGGAGGLATDCIGLAGYMYSGGNGAAGVNNGNSGGGGGSANNLGAGVNGSGTTGGNGGPDTANPPTTGKGGNGQTGNANGGNAAYYGGGGGGGKGTGYYGGYGISGRVVIVSYTRLRYSAISACIGTAVSTSPVFVGTASGFSVTPALPSGLSLNTSTGVISGTPTATQAATNYTVSATNGCGTAMSATVSITINGPSSASMSSGDWIFTGAVSVNYETASNWLKWNGTTFATQSAVPQIGDNVRIKPNGTCIARQPTATNVADGGFTSPISVSANCKNIVIESGAVLTFGATNPHFHVAGTFTNNGTIVTGTGRVKFIGTGAQSLTSVNTGETFYQLNIGASSITTINCNLTVTNLINLNGVMVTGTKILHLTNSASAASLPAHSGHIHGTFRRTIAANTDVYVFPVGVGSTMTTDKRALEFVNNNVTGVTYLDCSASNTFMGSGQNTNSFLDPVKARHYAQVFTVVNSAAEWTLRPNTAMSGGNYGVRLYLRNFSGLVDNNFSVLKRPDASTSFFDFDSYYLSTVIPAANLAGRIYSAGAGYGEKLGLTSFSKFVIASASTPLPVTLTHFAAECEQETVNLHWSTSSEQNSQKFTVERSRELTDWQSISEQPAAGNSSQPIDYHTIDPQALDGISYYRLIQTDFNGTEKIYGPISVSCGQLENEITVFPNPSNGNFTVQVSSTGDHPKARLSVHDATGKLILTQPAHLIQGTNQILFSSHALAAGAYMIHVTADEGEFKPLKLVVY